MGTLVLPRSGITPSYASGYAPRDGPPAFPNLHEELLAAWYPVLGVTGDTLQDVSGNGNDGQSMGAGAVTWESSEVGWQSVHSNGTTGGWDCGLPKNVPSAFPTGMSVVVVHKPAATGRDNGPVLLGREDIYSGWSVGSWYGLLEFFHNASTAYLYRRSETNWDWDRSENQVWQQQAMTWDGSVNASGIHLYKGAVESDGYYAGQDGVGLTDTSAYNLYIASDNSSFYEYGGGVACVLLYGRILTQSELSHLAGDFLAPVRLAPRYISLGGAAPAEYPQQLYNKREMTPLLQM